MYNIQLNEVQSYLYGLSSTFGNPPQSATFLVSNDQSLVMTPSLNCTTCSAASFFDSTQSNTFMQIASNQQISDTNMNATYSVATDVVCVGDLSGSDGFCIPFFEFFVVD
jgi:hypothetical protein